MTTHPLFFRLTHNDPAMDNDPLVRAWLDHIAQQVVKSNSYLAVEQARYEQELRENEALEKTPARA